jgi:glutamate---cysteine ligase / carboxylate-amine ligase
MLIRIHSSRYGFEGDFIKPYTFQNSLIIDDIIETVKKIERYANNH